MYYTPDFFLYNKQDDLYKIVEIRGHRLDLKERQDHIAELKEIINDIEVSLYTEIDLKEMCKNRDISYHKLKKYWRENPKNIKNFNVGEANAMYGKKHKESTKKILAEKGRQRYIDNPEMYAKTSDKMIAWCRKNNYDFLRGERVPRFDLICKECGKTFSVRQGNKDVRKYCSVSCGSKINIKLATQKTMDDTKKRNEELKNFVIDWAKSNKEIVLNIPLNKVETTIKDLLNKIEVEFGIIDIRTIMGAFEIKGRKEFAKKLKEYV